jgi:peptide deformylase
MVDASKRSITRYPAEVLAKRAQPVEKIGEDIRHLVERMTDIMIEQKGVGLAGPQAGVPLRIFIISLDGTRESVRVYINPTVTIVGDQVMLVEEGCLSVPGVYTKVRRYKNCTVTATDLDGRQFSEEAEGFYARALQHEYDHIEGVTIVNRMGQAARIAHRKKLKKLLDEQSP